MTPIVDRRTLVIGGVLGAAARAIPGYARAAQLDARGFTHGVASGEPGPGSVLLWTRFVPDSDSGGEATLRAEVSETPDFRRPVAGGVATSGPWRDHTVKVTVDGLRPGRRYHYRFVAPDGRRSPIGRTRTLPDAAARQCRLAVFSCANIGFGWFNAYAHAAARDDLDLVVHLGDYLYEFAPGEYPNRRVEVTARLPEPPHELLALADYRLRYASYRADPDLQALHAALPWIVSQDDHETADDTWAGGAKNHQRDEGDWRVRKAAAMQAWHEWMPVSDEPYRAYDLGTLATLFRTDTRQLARSRQPDLAGAAAADPVGGIAAFAAGVWRDPARTMMGRAQERWLAAAMQSSVRRGQRWQVVGSGTMVGRHLMPAAAPDWLAADAGAGSRRYVARGVAAAAFGVPANMDDWGGYPAARARLLGAARDAGAALIVVSGDSHNAWAFDLADEGGAAGVEFAGPAVTSSGLEATFAADPAVVVRGLIAASPELRWCDTSRRGYMTLTLEPDRARCDWHFVRTIAAPSTAIDRGFACTVRRGTRRLSPG